MNEQRPSKWQRIVWMLTPSWWDDLWWEHHHSESYGDYGSGYTTFKKTNLALVISIACFIMLLYLLIKK
jgi:hypothetical protein